LIGEVCSSIDRPPASAEISARLEKLETSGGLTDIWLGEHDGEGVAIKAFRTYPDESMREAKKVRIFLADFYKRVIFRTRLLQILWTRVPAWKRFSHPNVIGFRGVNASDPSRLALIYDLAVNGNIVQYTESHRDASRPALVLILLPNGFNYLTSVFG